MGFFDGLGGLLAGGGIGLVSGILGSGAQSDAADKASGISNAAAQRFYNFADPDYSQMLLNPDQYSVAGNLDPAMIQSILQGQSEMNGVKADPRLQKSEMDALATLSNIAGAGGMDAQSQLAFQQALSQSGQAARGAREANLSNAARRGASGSGLEFVSNQLADQDAANQAQMTGLNQAAAANQRDLEALKGMSDIGSNLTNRDLATQQARAQSQDAINRFNAQTQNSNAQSNTDYLNNAQQYNLTNKQNIANQNVSAKNYAQEKNTGIEQQKFANNLARAQGAGGLAGQQANAALQQGQASANLWGGLGQSALGTLGSIYANKKKD